MLLKAKCDHIHHVCTDGFAPICWRWSRRVFSLLTAYQILSVDFIYKPTWQSLNSKLQYNTCRRRMKVFSALPDHMFIISRYKFDHMWRLVCFFFVLGIFLLCRRRNFRALLPPETDDHMTIIRYSDLTTSLTINRTGVHGDKSVREYEKAVFA